MANHGFVIADLLDGVSLNIPPRKVNQLSDTELITTPRIAALQIHVGRAIGRIKTFKILHDLPNNMNRITDQIFLYVVCCVTLHIHAYVHVCTRQPIMELLCQ